MKKYFTCLPLFFLFSFLIIPVCNAANRQRLLMDYDWKFIQMDVQGAENPAFDDSRWRILNLPHDWSIEGEFKEDAPTKGAGGFLPTGIGWYRKHLSIPSIQKDQQFWIEFDGVYMNSDVWINGQHLGKNPNGYTSFYYDLTPFLKKGENIVAVKVDNSLQPNSRWYSGSGIYRHVWLNISDPVHVAQWGTYITTPVVDSTGATIMLRTTIENRLPKTKTITLRSIIKSAGKEVAAIETQVNLSPSAMTDQEQMLRIDKPLLWSVDNPSLYSMQTIILEGGKKIDNYDTPFGIRKIEFDKDKGLLLNGKHIKMNGVCLHHDAGCLGAAVPEQTWERRLQILKQMGCNAIRTSHNPVAPEFLNLCDKLGFLVMDEIYDEWEAPKGQVDYGYHVYFKKYYQTDLVSFIHRDRNHPSVVIWSAGNEVPEQGQNNGTEVLKKLIDIFHREDSTRPVTVANDHIGDAVYPVKPAFLELQDIIGYNYVDRWLDRRELFYSIDRHDHPNWKMIGTENTSIRGIRGKYDLKPEYQMSGRSSDYRTTMIRPEQLWKFTSLYDYVIGDFMWTGIDYLGESRWPSKNSSSGVIDMCGFPKDAFYFYKSQWNKVELMVHVFPHWNWSGYEGQVIPVYAYTNCDSVELFLNGKSFGNKCVVFPQQGNSGGWNKYAAPFVNQTTTDLHATWDVPYEPGILKVVGRKNGQLVTDVIQTSGKPVAIRLSADRTKMIADAHDIANIRVEVVDEKGLVVPDADNLIQFKIEGEGTLAGTDNGNPLDLTPMKSNKRRAFNGLCLTVVQSTLKGGTVKMIATSDNLKGADITLTTGRFGGPEVKGVQLVH